jgi:hypothetical protein
VGSKYAAGEGTIYPVTRFLPHAKGNAIFQIVMSEIEKYLNVQNYIARNLIVSYMTVNINRRK